MKNDTLKNFITGFITFLLLNSLFSCSPARYYHFDTYSINDKVFSQSVSLTPTSTKEEIEYANDRTNHNLSEKKTIATPEEIKIVAEPKSFSNERIHIEEISIDTIKTNRKQNNEQNTNSFQTGDRKKNGLAIGGFSAALAIPLIVFITLFTGSGAGFWVTIPVWLIGLIFSSLGLKSQKRKLAKTAFWILVVMGIIGIFGFLYFGLTLEGFGSMNVFSSLI